MLLVFKIIVLQIYWFLPITYSSWEYSFIFWPVSMAIAVINYITFKPNVSLKFYFLAIALFSLWGWFQDSLLIFTNTVDFGGNIFWLNSIWVVFIAYFGDVFNKFTQLKAWQLGLLGGVAGILSYLSGCRLAEVEIVSIWKFGLIIFVSWSLFLPASIKFFYANLKDEN